MPAADLRAHVVWLPILGKDNRAAAQMDAEIYDDPRLQHYWDPVAAQSVLWNQTLGMPAGQLAWDVYLVLGRGIGWKDAKPPVPIYWAHSLEMKIGAKYSPGDLRRAVEQALAKGGPAKAKPEPAPKK